MADERETGRPRAGSRFVLLCAPDHEGHVQPPDALRTALASRDAEITLHTSAYDAMADLVEHERAIRLHQRREGLVLLVVEPDRVEHARRLVDAAARYTPHAVCWRYDETARPQLSAYDRAPASPPTEAQPPVTIRPGVAERITPRPRPAAPKPHLRLTGDPEDPAHDHDEDQDSPERPHLSEEELEMLLSDDWERQTGEGGPA